MNEQVIQQVFRDRHLDYHRSSIEYFLKSGTVNGSFMELIQKCISESQSPIPKEQEDKPEESEEEYYQRKDAEIMAPRLREEIETLNGMLEVQQKTLEMFRDEKASLKDQLVACKSELEQSRKALQEQTELRWPTDEQIRVEADKRHVNGHRYQAFIEGARWLKQQVGNNQ